MPKASKRARKGSITSDNAAIAPGGLVPSCRTHRVTWAGESGLQPPSINASRTKKTPTTAEQGCFRSMMLRAHSFSAHFVDSVLTNPAVDLAPDSETAPLDSLDQKQV